MHMCWQEEYKRPAVDNVVAMLQHLQTSVLANSEEDFERRWEALKPNTIPITDNHMPEVRKIGCVSHNFLFCNAMRWMYKGEGRDCVYVCLFVCLKTHPHDKEKYEHLFLLNELFLLCKI